MKVVINTQFGGFGLSEAAYEKLIEWGIPVREYVDPARDPVTGLYESHDSNKGEVIFDSALDATGGERTEAEAALIRLSGRYWDSWTRNSGRTHPLVIRVVEELGEAANGKHATLKVVEIPDGVEYEIDEYDGSEMIREKHRSWR